jgi:hypothetical protein
MKIGFNSSAIAVDSEGRIRLSDEDLKAVESSFVVKAGGTTTNRGTGCGGTNDICRNTSGCAGSTNDTACTNSYTKCGTEEDQVPPVE